jgi:uncharacterized repeat protein (TIGR01451 family)
VKEFVPAGAPFGAQDVITVSAAFNYTNAAPALNVTLPNEVLTYTVTYTNNGPIPLSSIVINDATPGFTLYVGSSAGRPGLVGRTTCTVAVEPAANATGALQWNITGSLLPGASSTVQLQVRVEP